MLYALLALLGLGGAAIALGGPKDPTPGKIAHTFTKTKRLLWYSSSEPPTPFDRLKSQARLDLAAHILSEAS